MESHKTILSIILTLTDLFKISKSQVSNVFLCQNECFKDITKLQQNCNKTTTKICLKLRDPLSFLQPEVEEKKVGTGEEQ